MTEDMEAASLEEACNLIAVQFGSGHQPGTSADGRFVGVRLKSWQSWHDALDQLWDAASSPARVSGLILLGESVARYSAKCPSMKRETTLVCSDFRTLDFAWRRLRLSSLVLDHISRQSRVNWCLPPLDLQHASCAAGVQVVVAMPTADQVDEIARHWLAAPCKFEVVALCYQAGDCVLSLPRTGVSVTLSRLTATEASAGNDPVVSGTFEAICSKLGRERSKQTLRRHPASRYGSAAEASEAGKWYQHLCIATWAR